MDRDLDRRGFLVRLMVAPLLARPFPFATPFPSAAITRRYGRATLPPASEAALPPRVVGLRSRGGAFRFDPPGLRLELDAPLVWLNMGDFHTATAFHPDNDELLGENVPLRIPEGAESWHSGMLGLTDGTQFEHRFPVPGVYDYFCQPHYGFGMVGRLVVDGARGGPGSTATDGLPDAVRENLPPVDAIMGPRGRGWEWASRLNGVLLLRTSDHDARPGARAVQEGMAADEELASHLEGDPARSELEARVARFVDGVTSGADYEELVRRADRTKELL